MPAYFVPYVRRYLLPLWTEYRETCDPCDRVIEAAVHGLLDLSATVEAADAEAAIHKVERMFPGHEVVRTGIKIVGD